MMMPGVSFCCGTRRPTVDAPTHSAKQERRERGFELGEAVGGDSGRVWGVVMPGQQRLGCGLGRSSVGGQLTDMPQQEAVDGHVPLA